MGSVHSKEASVLKALDGPYEAGRRGAQLVRAAGGMAQLVAKDLARSPGGK